MRIGLVCPYNICSGGGVQESVLAMQWELKRRGHMAFIITPLSREPCGKEHADTLFIGTGADLKYPFHTTAQVSASTNPEEIDDILQQHKFDILHFHEPWVPMLSRQILGKSRDIINVATFHAKLPDTVVTRTIEKVITPYTKSILKDLNNLTAVSDAAAMYVSSLTHKQVEIIPNGIDLDKYHPTRARRAPTKQKMILFVGRLEKRKGVNYLLDAFARLDDPNVRLVIAGTGPDAEKLQSYVKEHHIRRVEFLGFVSEEVKLKLLHEADLFCSPAIYGESFGIVLLEAMATGTVAIAANNPGYVSVMKDRGVLSLVNPRDADEFARRIQLLLYDQDIAKLWRDWAKDYVKQFDYPSVVDRYENLYKYLLKKK
jgi:phosphatidyl-myo-inositol alpha-mannosyltransferase